jgi:predicted CXXCH cytochrome family protein
MRQMVASIEAERDFHSHSSMKKTLILCHLFLCLMCLYGMVVEAANLAPKVSGRKLFLADFDQPTAVAASANGLVYVLDGARNRIVVLSATGNRLASFGDGLNHPLDLVWIDDFPLQFASTTDNSEWLLVADTGHHRLVLFRPQGSLIKSIPLQDAGAGLPEPVAVAHRDGIAYWSDRKSQKICRTRLDNGITLDCFGGRGEMPGQFQYPYQMAWDRDGYLQVIDILNARVQVFHKTGRYFSQVSRFGLMPGELFRPNGLAIERESDTLFVSDGYFGTIKVFKKGESLGVLKDEQGQPLILDSPTGLFFRDGQLYVAETGASRVHRFSLAVSSESEQTVARSARSDATEGEVSQKNCLLCHWSWADESPPEKRVQDAQGALPEASYKMCYSCHNGPVMDSRESIHRGAQHPTVYESLAEKKRHAQAGPRQDQLPDRFPVTPDHQLTCTSCHTPHTDSDHPEVLYSGHGNAWLRVPNRGGDLCERCHESKGKGAREEQSAAKRMDGEARPRPIIPARSMGATPPTREEKGRNHPLAIQFAPPPFEGLKGYVSQPELRQGLPLRLSAGGAVLGQRNELICQTCHQVHGGYGDGQLTVLNSAQGELCSSCHLRQFTKSQAEAHQKGVHPINVKPEKPILWKGKKIVEVTCETCHKVHDGAPGTPLLPEGIDQAEALCQVCHQRQHAEDQDDARRKGVHPVNAKLDERVEINGKSFERVGCLTCHAVHHGQPNTAALVETDRDGELCSHCHRRKQTVVGTDHDLRITAKDHPNAHHQLPTQSSVCGACHSLHRGRGESPFLFAAKRVEAQLEAGSEPSDETSFERDRLCLNCHQKGGLGEKKVVKHFSHPHEDLVLRSDKNVMPLLDIKEKFGEFGRIACVTCHEPHVWDIEKAPSEKKSPTAVRTELSAHPENQEGRNRDSFLRHKGVSGTFCIDCHGIEGLLKYKYFHDPLRARYKSLNYLH